MQFDEVVGTKSRKTENPYAVFRAGDWEWRVLKRYGKSEKPYARWFTAVSSPYTFGSFDLGDTYVADVVRHGQLVEVEGRAPTTEETLAVSELFEQASAPGWS